MIVLPDGGIMNKRCFAAVAALMLGTSAQATILTFDGAQRPAGQSVLQTYGDKVAGSTQGVFGYGVGSEGYTPNVSVRYSGNTNWQQDVAGADQGLWVRSTGYGDLSVAVFNALAQTASIPSRIIFTADEGYEVALFGLDVAGRGEDLLLKEVSVTSAGETVFSQLNIIAQGDANGPRRTAIDFGAPIYRSSLVLTIGNGQNPFLDYIGFDNIRFGQRAIATTPPVETPEPAALGLLGLGLVGMTFARRRMQSQ